MTEPAPEQPISTAAEAERVVASLTTIMDRLIETVEHETAQDHAQHDGREPDRRRPPHRERIPLKACDRRHDDVRDDERCRHGEGPGDGVALVVGGPAESGEDHEHRDVDDERDDSQPVRPFGDAGLKSGHAGILPGIDRTVPVLIADP